MADDPKAAKQAAEEVRKKLEAATVDTSKLKAVIKEGNALKGDKDNPD